MYQDKKSVLIFGVGPLQESIIGRAKKMGLYTVGIDPCEDAVCKDCVDSFEVVGGQDFEGTCAVVEDYGIDAIVTAATDKPLVMMARIAEKYGFPFFSVETARWSTDKFQMKRRFELGGIPHAQGRLVSKIEDTEGFTFPVIVKPRDNSGSRGVKLCRNTEELKESIKEALENSKLDTVLVEEFIEGQEYSIEGLHYDGKSEVIQFTEKKTTEFPYNVELGHIQPANISEENKKKVRVIIAGIGRTLGFENCPSHTELKINKRGIFVIETSPRLGGDYITSTLVPLSTGINLEDQILRLSLGEQPNACFGHPNKAAGICFLQLPCGKVEAISPSITEVADWPSVFHFSASIKVGDSIAPITSSLTRYGEFIVQSDDRIKVEDLICEYNKRIANYIVIQGI